VTQERWSKATIPQSGLSAENATIISSNAPNKLSGCARRIYFKRLAKGAHSVAELRAMSAQDLLKPVTGGSPPRFGPVVDGHFLTATPNEIFAEGKQNDVPELTGCSKNGAPALRRYG
jgi:carboxylesterase type B